jgi:hypothetical protein
MKTDSEQNGIVIACPRSVTRFTARNFELGIISALNSETTFLRNVIVVDFANFPGISLETLIRALLS